MRDVAKRQWLDVGLRAEFDADPFAYRSKYGTINSYEGGMGVEWAFREVARLRRELSETSVECIRLAAENRLLREAK